MSTEAVYPRIPNYVKRFGWPLPKLAGAEEPGGAAESAAAAQGGEGEAGVNGLYQSVLGGFPEELRPYAEEPLKKWEQSVTPRLMEAAELRKKYAPFEGVEGLTDVDPEELKQLIGFRDVLGDEDRFLGWLQAVNEQMGVMTLDSLDQDVWQQLGETNGWLDGEGLGEEGGESALASQVAELQEQLQAIHQSLTAQQQEQVQRQQVEEVTNRMAADLESLHEQHGEFDDQRVLQLAHAYLGDEDAISKAFQDYLEIRGTADGERVDRQLGQPEPALTGGRPNTSPPKFDGLGDPALKEAALNRLRT